MDLDKNYLKDLFIDEVKGCLGSDGGGGYDSDGDGIVDNSAQLGGIPASEYALKTDIESSIASDEDANQIIDDIFASSSSSVATEEEVSDIINSVFN